MAVLVDSEFFDALGKMDDVPHLANCAIAWFVVSYEFRDKASVYLHLRRNSQLLNAPLRR